MAWELRADRQIWLQLAERLRYLIVSGRYPAGSRIPSVRELAAVAGVNPNTMQRALASLEDSGLLCAAGAAGRFVTDNELLIREVRDWMAVQEIKQCKQRLAELGFSPQQMGALWREENA